MGMLLRQYHKAEPKPAPKKEQAKAEVKKAEPKADK